MSNTSTIQEKRKRRIHRVRAMVSGTAERPRFAVSRSNRGIAVQLIDDTLGKTIVSASGKELAKQSTNLTKTDTAFAVGELIAKKAVAAGITSAVFDRRSYAYHGRVKAAAEGARKGGLTI